MKSSTFGVLALLIVMIALPLSSFAQSSLPRFAAGVKAGTLGIGVEGATAVTQRSNVRFGFNFYDYDDRRSRDGITYTGTLSLHSLQVTYDQYLYSGFHVSPGFLVYNDNEIDAKASVPPGASFTLGNARFFSNPANPIGGTGHVRLGRSAPMVLFGVGNLLPRSGRHLGINFDAGVAFQKSPESTLNITGTACTISPTTGCVNAATDPVVQSNIRVEQQKINDDLEPLKYYPVVSLGISWRF